MMLAFVGKAELHAGGRCEGPWWCWKSKTCKLCRNFFAGIIHVHAMSSQEFKRRKRPEAETCFLSPDRVNPR